MNEKLKCPECNATISLDEMILQYLTSLEFTKREAIVKKLNNVD
jgi:hypothetical protein